MAGYSKAIIDPLSGVLASNRHPVDQLAEVRAQIKALQERESALKDAVLTAVPTIVRGESQTVTGDDFIARVSYTERETMDREAVERALGARFAKCLKSSSSLTIRIAPKAHFEEAA